MIKRFLIILFIGAYSSIVAQDTLVKSIFFDFNQYIPTETSHEDIRRFAAYVKSNPIFVLEMNAYGDKIGTRANNIKLAKWRLETIRELFDSTIHVQEYNAYGLDYPAESPYDFNDSEKWRRVDIIYRFVNPQTPKSSGNQQEQAVAEKLSDSQGEKEKEKEKENKKENNAESSESPQKPAKEIEKSVKTKKKSKQYKSNTKRGRRKSFERNVDEKEIISTLVLNIGFEGNKTHISGGSYSELDKFARYLRQNPSVHVMIRGHVCCKNKYRISKKRAKNVYKAMILRGIDPKRMSFEGYGNRIPLVYPETSEAERSLNRRVDAVVIKKEK